MGLWKVVLRHPQLDIITALIIARTEGSSNKVVDCKKEHQGALVVFSSFNSFLVNAYLKYLVAVGLLAMLVVGAQRPLVSSKS